MTTLPIIRTEHLFRQLDGLLLDLLQSLSRDEWSRPTIVPRWNVHHVAVHLLDTALRRLSLCRDGWAPVPPSIHSEQDLVDLINRLNAEGVATLGRLSPELVVTLTATVTPQLAAYLEMLDPMAPASFAVSWAGETESQNWFDVAREFTERWHHQQQVRLATNRPGILTPQLYAPVLETFMRVLPHTYRHVDASDGTVCEFIVPGECGGSWSLSRRHNVWQLTDGHDAGRVVCTCIIPPDVAWRLFTKGVSRDEAAARIERRGDQRLGAVVLGALAIVG